MSTSSGAFPTQAIPEVLRMQRARAMELAAKARPPARKSAPPASAAAPLAESPSDTPEPEDPEAVVEDEVGGEPEESSTSAQELAVVAPSARPSEPVAIPRRADPALEPVVISHEIFEFTVFVLDVVMSPQMVTLFIPLSNSQRIAPKQSVELQLVIRGERYRVMAVTDAATCRVFPCSIISFLRLEPDDQNGQHRG